MYSTGRYRVIFTLLAAFAAFVCIWSGGSPAHAGPIIGNAEAILPPGAVAVSAEAPSDTVSFAIILPVNDQAALDTLLGRLYNPADPMYRQFLTPAQFDQEFGASGVTYAAIMEYLQSQGFTITRTYNNHLLLGVTGTAAQAESLFGVNMLDCVTADGQTFHAPDQVPSIPGAISGFGVDVVGLNNAPKAHNHLLHPLIPYAAPQGSTGPQDSGYAPKDIKNAYNLAATKDNGSGQNLVLFELDGFTESDIDNYNSYYKLNAPTPQTVLIDGFSGFPTGDGGDVEVTLDIEMMMALAPGSQIIVYETYNDSQDADEEYTQIAEDDKGNSVSTSWGLWEGFGEGPAETPAFEQMAAEGISMYAAAGDDGAYDNDSTYPPSLGVDDPAVQPLVCGVGGTKMEMNATATARQSEVAWGDPTEIYDSPLGSGGGGGISSIYPIPSYQKPVVFLGSDSSQYSTTFRNVPDVCLNADPATPYSLYYEGWASVGGTSAAAPLWAAFTGLVDEDLADNHVIINSATATLGQTDPTIYPIALDSTMYARDFFDITSGNNLYYDAVTGYDDATGWGSFDGADLLADLVHASGGPVSFPTITELSPNSAPSQGPPVTLIISGTGFKAGTTAYWNSVALASTLVNSDEVSATIPSTLLGALGPYTITVENKDGTSSGPATFTVTKPGPNITSLSPGIAAEGSTGFTLTINGSGFLDGATVTWNGNPLAGVTFSNSALLTVPVPAAVLANPGNIPVIVTNPDQTASQPFFFEVIALTPTLATISPTTAQLDSQAFTLTATGANFSDDSVILWNGASLGTPTAVSSTSISATVPSTDLTQSGGVSVAVETPGPGGGTTSPLTFTISFPPPTLTSLNPTFTPAGTSNLTLVVTGTGFLSGAMVNWNGTSLATVYVSGTQLDATVPSGDVSTVGSAQITVVNPDNQATAALPFYITAAAPVIQTLTPPSAVAGSGQLDLTIGGLNFQSGATLGQSAVASLGSYALTITQVTPTTISAIVPSTALASAGLYPVVVTNPDHGLSAPFNFVVDNPVPAITQLAPTFIAVGAPATTITVTGTGFVSTSQVQWNGTAVATTYGSATQLTAVVPAADLSSATTGSITVFNPAPGGGLSGAASLPVENPLPVLSSISPNFASQPAVVPTGPGVTLTVYGSSFVPSSTDTQGSYVTWNGGPLTTTYVSAGELTANIPATDITSVSEPTSATVAVETPGPGGGASATTVPFYIAGELPMINTISAPSLAGPVSTLPVGSPQTTLTITGSSFVSGATVTFVNPAITPAPSGTYTNTATFVSSSQLTISIPASEFVAAALAQVTITNPDQGMSAPQAFPITNLTPANIAIVSPSPATVIAGVQTTITVSGTNFLSTSQILINGTALTTTMDNSGNLDANIPANFFSAAGTAAVAVENPQPGGGASGTVPLTVVSQAATVTAVSPNTAQVGSPGLELTVTGTDFASGAIVAFGGTSLVTTFQNSTTLLATLPAALLSSSPGPYQITVTNPGTTTGAGVTFTLVNGSPGTISLSPTTVAVGSSAFTLTITGTGFTSNSSATWNGTALTVDVLSATEITATVPATLVAAAGTFPVIVTVPSPGGGPTSPAYVMVTNPLPALTSVSTQTTAISSTPITITATGTNFVTGSVLRFSGAPLDTTYNSATSLTATIPVADLKTAGTFNLTVLNPGPGGGVSTPGLPFTVTSASPTISALDPASVVAGSGEFNLSVSGQNFVPGAKVLLSGSPLVTTLVSPEQLIATVPAADILISGTLNVSVKVGSSATGLLPLTVVAAAPVPAVTGLTPSSIPAGSAAFDVTVQGMNFSTTSTVTWNGTSLTTGFVSPTQLLINVPASLVTAPGSATITVTTPAPGGGTSAAIFTITYPNPSLTSISPTVVTVGSGNVTLTVTGSNFLPGSTITFGGQQLPTNYETSTTLTTTISASELAATGTDQVFVTNPPPDGGVSSARTFTIQAAVLHTFASGLQMISVPYDFSEVPLSQALDQPNTILAAWDPATGVYNMTPTAPADVFHRGQGYWVDFSVATDLLNLGQPPAAEEYFTIDLQAGWNMIGCPYASAVPISSMTVVSQSNVLYTVADAVTADIVDSDFYTYDANSATKYDGQNVTGSIQPYVGYWLYVTAPCQLRVPAPGTGG